MGATDSAQVKASPALCSALGSIVLLPAAAARVFSCDPVASDSIANVVRCMRSFIDQDFVKSHSELATDITAAIELGLDSSDALVVDDALSALGSFIDCDGSLNDAFVSGIVSKLQAALYEFDSNQRVFTNVGWVISRLAQKGFLLQARDQDNLIDILKACGCVAKDRPAPSQQARAYLLGALSKTPWLQQAALDEGGRLSRYVQKKWMLLLLLQILHPSVLLAS